MLSGGLSRAAAAPRRVVRGQLRLVRLSVERFVAMDGFDRSMALAAQAFTRLAGAVFALYAILHPGLHGHVPGSFELAASLAGGTVFWLLAPYVILARRLPWRRLMPQAVLAALGIAALRAAPRSTCRRRSRQRHSSSAPSASPSPS